ncbi:MAG: asparagine synthase (glutamine-hydrolyzing) [Paludisphaera borealis]|uniref:asparagine synthase (glutamine-hydrolyzing) n=1 Tax=Paludisphaera borealis TaxID=1387353 RepID=UPI00285009C9|nr:asparagine synthase (glutamine-hydrolyzing) [Paludisphaera borealis]MDR3623157.1 asparagine synthase (glutamine-hydrolyzing) [Paludisphaera borealis]
MCGFAGLLDSSRSAQGEAPVDVAQRMVRTLRHRGPDDEGAWSDPEAGFGVGFRRLSIVDLSPLGHQPMESVGGRFVLAFNGEIYNHRSLRRDLEARGRGGFRGNSDTEVLLQAIELWGLEDAVRRFVGMFAFALWDRRERRLHLVRDRVGEKPLYYGRSGSAFLFGSELKALRAYPGFNAEVDREILAPYLQFGYIPAPFSIYKGIFKLIPGTILTVTADRADVEPTPIPYWSAARAVEAGRADRLDQMDERGAVDQLECLLRDAVGQQMVADVPLGAFLSGGIDSSVVVALMQAQSDRPVKTFTIGFHEKEFNEALHARLVADHLGTEHTELYVTPEEAMAVVPELPAIYDEPFADASQIPTLLVSRLARRDVTVSLSGDGGDELFAGYPWYRWSPDVWKCIGWMPRALRLATARALVGLPTATWDRIFGGVGRLLPSEVGRFASGDRMHKLALLVAKSNGPEDGCRNLLGQWGGAPPLLGEAKPRESWVNGDLEPDRDDVLGLLMYIDLVDYLPDDIMTKVDRSSMAVSLESRAPLLDHRIVEFAWRLPKAMRIRDGRGKWLLRQVLYRHVPAELIDRPKMGFVVPIDAWLRGPLRDWAEALLDEDRLRSEGFFDPVPIRRKWEEHLSGKRNWQHELWRVLMFETWLEAC